MRRELCSQSKGAENFLPPSVPKKIHMDRYWGEMAVLTDGCGEIKFPTLVYFVESLLSFLYSNADVERITLIKTLSNRTNLKDPHWILF